MSAPGFRRRLDAVAPVVSKEMRSLLRGWQAPAALLLCVGLAAAGEVAALRLLAPGGTDTTPEALAATGRQIFAWVSLLEGLLVVLLAPLLTAQAITEERRRGTLEGLLLTRLTPRDILWGKLLAATGFLLIVIVSMLPVQSILILFGGIAPLELVGVTLLLLAVAPALAAYGLFCSLRYFTPLAAVANAYAGALSLIAPWQLLILRTIRAENPRVKPAIQSPNLYLITLVSITIVLIIFSVMPVLLFFVIVLVVMSCPANALACLFFGDDYLIRWLPFAEYLWLIMTPLAIFILLFLTRKIMSAAATLLHYETSRAESHAAERGRERS